MASTRPAKTSTDLQCRLLTRRRRALRQSGARGRLCRQPDWRARHRRWRCSDAQYAFVDDLTAMLLTTEEVDTLKDIYDRLGPAEIFAPVDAALSPACASMIACGTARRSPTTRNVIWSQRAPAAGSASIPARFSAKETAIRSTMTRPSSASPPAVSCCCPMACWQGWPSPTKTPTSRTSGSAARATGCKPAWW